MRPKKNLGRTFSYSNCYFCQIYLRPVIVNDNVIVTAVFERFIFEADEKIETKNCVTEMRFGVCD